jgi:hypothetical protein
MAQGASDLTYTVDDRKRCCNPTFSDALLRFFNRNPSPRWRTEALPMLWIETFMRGAKPCEDGR